MVERGIQLETLIKLGNPDKVRRNKIKLKEQIKLRDQDKVERTEVKKVDKEG